MVTSQGGLGSDALPLPEPLLELLAELLLEALLELLAELLAELLPELLPELFPELLPLVLVLPESPPPPPPPQAANIAAASSAKAVPMKWRRFKPKGSGVWPDGAAEWGAVWGPLFFIKPLLGCGEEIALVTFMSDMVIHFNVK